MALGTTFFEVHMIHSSRKKMKNCSWQVGKSYLDREGSLIELLMSSRLPFVTQLSSRLLVVFLRLLKSLVPLPAFEIRHRLSTVSLQLYRHKFR